MSNIRFLPRRGRTPPTALDLYLAEGGLIDKSDYFFLLQCRNRARQSVHAEMRAHIEDAIRRVEAAKARGLERIPFRATNMERKS